MYLWYRKKIYELEKRINSIETGIKEIQFLCGKLGKGLDDIKRELKSLDFIKDLISNVEDTSSSSTQVNKKEEINQINQNNSGFDIYINRRKIYSSGSPSSWSSASDHQASQWGWNHIGGSSWNGGHDTSYY